MPTSLKALNTLTLTASLPGGVRFETEAGPLEVTCYAPGIFRLRFGVDARPDYDLLVAPPEAPEVIVTSDAGSYRLACGDLVLELLPDPLRLRLLRGDKVLLGSTEDGHISGGWRLPPLARADDLWQIALRLRSKEPVYGLGEKYGPLDRRGQLIESWNEDALGVNAERSYKNCPFAWSTAGWGVFVHTTGRVQHGVGYPQWSHRSYVLRVEDAVLDLFLMAAETPAAMLERYTHLTGRAPRIPRWSLGVWLSRCYYKTGDELLAAARGMREAHFPCDVITLDGRAWLKVQTRFGFEWDDERYPDPAAFVQQVKALGYRLCVWEYPYISIHNPLFDELAEKGYLLRDAEGAPYLLQWDAGTFGTVLTPLPTSGILDFTNPAAYAWYRDMHERLFAVGVDVLKTDFGEQVGLEAVAFNGATGDQLHNVYPLLYNRCVYEATARYHEGEPLVWGRSGWTGSQRYPMQWGGDSQGDWEGLAASIRGGLSWGMSGVPFYTHDIGGFYDLHKCKPMPEHYIRSMQVGVLSSHTRFHGTTCREPWEFGPEVETIVREWLELRYRLIPYLEACAEEASRTGLPVMRAMPLAFPKDRVAWDFEEQYMLGPALLVAPVLCEDGAVTLYLPAGVWYDFWTGERIEGPAVLERQMSLEQTPIYGRAGTYLPLGPVVQNTEELPQPTPIEEVWVFGELPAGTSLPDDVKIKQFV